MEALTNTISNPNNISQMKLKEVKYCDPDDTAEEGQSQERTDSIAHLPSPLPGHKDPPPLQETPSSLD